MKKIVTFFVLLILSGVLAFLLSQKNGEFKSCRASINLYLDEYNKLLVENNMLKKEIEIIQSEDVIEQEVIEEEIIETGFEILFQDQPQNHGGSYQSNTTILNAYAKKNMQDVILSEEMVGQLVIKLKKNLKSHLVLYAKTSNIYCGGRLSVQPNEDNEVIIDFSGFKIGKINCILFDNKGNLPSKLSLGGYVASFDGNGIEKITVK